MLLDNSSHNGTYLKDTGYTKCCPICSLRWDHARELINHERDLELIICRTCSKKKAEIAAKRELELKNGNN